MWRGPVRGALFRGISHQSNDANHPIVNSVCRDKTVIQGATDLLQQPELREQWTIYTTLYVIHAINRPKFIIKIGELFSQINQFIKRVQNYI